MKTKAELIHNVAKFFGCKDNMVQLQPLEVRESMSSHIEDGPEGSIFRFKLIADGRTVVVKMKNNSFINNVGETMNYYGSDSFREYYKNGYGLFYTRNSFCREKYIYTYLDESLRQFIPHYYGTVDVSEQECLHIMEDIPIKQYPVDLNNIVSFLVALHVKYMGDTLAARQMKVNIPDINDYKYGKDLSMILFDNIQKLHPTFPIEIIEDLKRFACDSHSVFEQLHTYPRTVCHGDFSIKNLTFLQNRVVVYDWELSTYNNPEFDLISLMVFYPDKLDDRLVCTIVNRYYRELRQKIDLRYDTNAALFFNIKLLMVSRFHAMMNIAMRVAMPFMNTAVYNWIYLYNYFKTLVG
ncbi:MAG: phosphotransferase [Christensenellales bacterium]